MAIWWSPRTRLTGRGRGSGVVLEMRIGQLWTFRDGKVIRSRLSHRGRSPRSRRAFGVGDVAGERGGRAREQSPPSTERDVDALPLLLRPRTFELVDPRGPRHRRLQGADGVRRFCAT